MMMEVILVTMEGMMVMVMVVVMVGTEIMG